MLTLAVIVEFAESIALLAFGSVLIALLGRRLDACRRPCQAVIGVILGSVGVISMAAPVVAGPGLVFDARAVVAILAGPLAGPLGAAISAAMLAGMRLATGGAGTVAGIASIGLAGAFGILFWYRLRLAGRALAMADLPILGMACALVPFFSTLLLPTWSLALEMLSAATPLSAITNALGVMLLGMLLLWDRERRAVNAALQESESRLRSIADNAPGALYQRVRTADGRTSYRYLSDGAMEILGVPASAVMQEARAALDLMMPEDVTAYQRSLEISAATLSSWRCDSRIRRPDGRVVWLHDQSTPRRNAQGDTIWDGFFLDVTEQKQLEQQLQAAQRTAEEANAAKSRFLALVTHELRSPLNAICGYVDLIKSGVHGPLGDPRYVRYLGTIRAASTHLAAVVDDLMDLSKIEAGKIQLAPEQLELADLIAEVADILRVRAEDGGVILGTSVPPRTQAWADRARLRQVLLNLATNAIRFTPPGGEVRIAAAPGGEGVCRITVSDTGIGISPEHLRKVLEPFFQVDNEVNRKGGGTGLGLPLSKQLVELHGGHLSIRSTPGCGTTVTIELAGKSASAGPQIATDLVEAMAG